MREEIDFFGEYLEPTSGVAWECPITYLIKKTPLATTFGDACLDTAGCFSVEFTFPPKSVRQALKYLNDNRGKNLISINVLEFSQS